MAGGRLVEGGGDHLAAHRTAHFGDFLRAFVDEQDDEVALGMIGRDAVGDVLQHHGLAGLGRRNDEAALALADGRDHVDDAGGQVFGAAVALFETQGFLGEQGCEVFEQDLVVGGLRPLEIDLIDFQQREVALAFLGGTDPAGDGVAGPQIEPADLARRDIDVVGARQIRAVPGSEKPYPSCMISMTPSPKISSPFFATCFRMAKMMSCLRDRAVPSMFIDCARATSSAAGIFFRSVRFMQ